jgi:tRNA modification GTPase
MATKENSAIVLTPRGTGAIAVVRLRGPGVRDFLARHFSRQVVLGQCVHGRLKDGLVELDDPIVVTGPSGDWVDFNLHGGIWVVESVLELARREGFEEIELNANGLPETAVDGDSVLETEMLAHLPLATTELALSALLAQPKAWEGKLPEPAEMLADEALWRLLHPPRIAIIGRPNVGKSTLANRLFGQERSITADVPGTTRDWVGEMANLDGLAAMLLDTPGTRESEDLLEQVAIAQSLHETQEVDLRIWVLDATDLPASEPPKKADSNLVVINKIDRLADVTRAALANWHHAIQISALSGQGMPLLIEQIHRRFGLINFDRAKPRWWTDRHRNCLKSGTPLWHGRLAHASGGRT